MNDYKENIRKIEEALYPKPKPRELLRAEKTAPLVAPTDISLINANAFMRNTRRSNVTISYTSLYKINGLISDRK